MGLAVTVDVVIFAMRERALHVLLVERGKAPYQGRWAIPGGFVEADETLEQAALRELEEETGVKDVYVEQLYTFGDPGRDPRGRVITVSYFAMLGGDGARVVAGDDASDARWFAMDALPELAFDHDRILAYALERLRNKLEYTTAGFSLLPEKFTLTELQRVYEAILGRKLEKRNFRRKMGLLKILQGLREWRKEGLPRPAKLYRFRAERFEKLKDKGILFPF